jgi:anthranilate phosphoribosyltransferase
VIVEAINELINGRNLTRDHARSVMDEIMEGRATQAQIGAYLIAQRMQGENVEEITGAVESMRAKATKIPVTVQGPLIDTCGTGGDASHTVNISTAAAVIAASCGVKVAKHGNRSVSSKCGSADVLQALGANLDLTPEQVGACIDSTGLGFLFAPLLHGAMKYAIGPRKEIGQRTIFNLLGPLTNPAGTRRQVVGVFHPGLTEKIAQVLGTLGAEHVWVVCGMDGLDEVSISGETRVSEYKGGVLRTFTICPEDVGLKSAPIAEIKGNDPATNAGIILEAFRGRIGAVSNVFALNAGAALVVAGIAQELEDGVQMALEALKSGAALHKLNSYIQQTQSF